MILNELEKLIQQALNIVSPRSRTFNFEIRQKDNDILFDFNAGSSEEKNLFFSSLPQELQNVFNQNTTSSHSLSVNYESLRTYLNQNLDSFAHESAKNCLTSMRNNFIEQNIIKNSQAKLIDFENYLFNEAGARKEIDQDLLEKFTVERNDWDIGDEESYFTLFDKNSKEFKIMRGIDLLLYQCNQSPLGTFDEIFDAVQHQKNDMLNKLIDEKFQAYTESDKQDIKLALKHYRYNNSWLALKAFIIDMINLLLPEKNHLSVNRSKYFNFDTSKQLPGINPIDTNSEIADQPNEFSQNPILPSAPPAPTFFRPVIPSDWDHQNHLVSLGSSEANYGPRTNIPRY